MLHLNIILKKAHIVQTMKIVGILALASAAAAHTLFTTLYIDGKNQGDGTCVRMPKNGATGTAPIRPITGDAMACGTHTTSALPLVHPNH